MFRNVVMLGLIAFACAIAQTPTGVIVGSVTDPSGATVTGAKIELVNESTGLVRHTVSGVGGAFRIPDLPVGVYALSVAVSGFQQYEQGGITLVVNQNVTVDVVLQVGAISEKVTVSSAPTQVDIVSGSLSSVVGEREATEFPLDGRNVLQLMALNPGLGGTETYHAGITSGGTGNTTYAVNGSRGDMVNFLLDGATNNDDHSNNSNYYPNPDAVQEFSVLTNNFSAEYGMGAGGIVNAVSKSGTNRLRGSAFEFLRNNALNAADFFSHQVDTLKRNQYGFTIGGPVYLPKLYRGHDKTFFFYSYQATKYRLTATTRTALVPTAAERAGDFSHSTLPQAKDPLTAQPFPSNQIPATRFDPVMIKMLNATVPLPNGGGNLLMFSTQTIQDGFEHLIKIDHSITANNKLTGRMFLFDFNGHPAAPTPSSGGVDIFGAANGNLNRSINAWSPIPTFSRRHCSIILR
jgi:hypothetical protein